MRVQTEVYVDLDAFDDCDILDAAAEIVRQQLSSRKGLSKEALDLETAFLVAHEEFPPISTAARITTIAELNAWREREASGASEKLKGRGL